MPDSGFLEQLDNYPATAGSLLLSGIGGVVLKYFGKHLLPDPDCIGCAKDIIRSLENCKGVKLSFSKGALEPARNCISTIIEQFADTVDGREIGIFIVGILLWFVLALVHDYKHRRLKEISARSISRWHRGPDFLNRDWLDDL